MKAIPEMATQQDINPGLEAYFESEHDSNLCGLHAVNNLLGEPYYTRETFEAFCEELEAREGDGGGHRHCCQCIGDYGEAVLEIALKKAGY